MLELHFRVVDGFHVNSHTPKSELLIPTQISLQTAAGVKAEAVEYPAGTSYSFSFDPTEKLDVYTGGAFTVKLPVVAELGTHGGWDAALPGLRPRCLLSAEDSTGAGYLYREVAFQGADEQHIFLLSSLGTPAIVCEAGVVA